MKNNRKLDYVASMVMAVTIRVEHGYQASGDRVPEEGDTESVESSNYSYNNGLFF